MFSVYDFPLFRPPSEANSIIVQATYGCSHNRCTFCGMYKMKKFRVRGVEEIRRDLEILRNFQSSKKLFIADGNALCIETGKLIEIIRTARSIFPEVERVSIYATPMDILEKSRDELKALKKEGLELIYLGLESGDDQVLREVRKGCNSDEMIEACRKAMNAGIDMSITAITGLGGEERSYEHAKNTAGILNEIRPKYTAFLSLIPVEGTLLYLKIKKGTFKPLSQIEHLKELRWVVEDLNYRTVFRANHASNYLPLKAELPDDRESILKLIDYAISHPEVLKPEYLRAL